MKEQANNLAIVTEVKPALDKIQRSKDKSHLSLEGCHIENYEALVKYFTKYMKIRILDLSDTKIDLDSLQKLVVGINQRNVPITSLSLNQNVQIDDHAANMLSFLFTTKSSVRELSLD